MALPSANPPLPQPVADNHARRNSQQPEGRGGRVGRQDEVSLARPERLAVEAADAQRGLITHFELRKIGYSNAAIHRLTRCGWLTWVHEGVYAVGTALLDPLMRWQAATLACGPDGLLANLSAAGLWDVWPPHESRPHVLIPGNGRRGHDGIVVHRMRRIHPDDIAEHESIPVTSLELTCLHLGAVLGRRSYERMVVRAARRSEFSIDRALALCERSRGRPGLAAFRRVVARDLAAELRSLSELELRFVELLRRHSIPTPEINRDVGRYVVDAIWHEKKLIVELDGYEFHKLPRDLRSDNARTRQLVLAGYRVVRFVWSDVVNDPQATAATLNRLLD